jgi:dihydrofolate synthase/folylpolyglutamate synthase
MNFKQTVNWLYDQLPVYQRDGFFKHKLNLDSIKAVCDKLNNPQNNFKSIHVAGTNGKGSSSHMLASIFHEAGYKVGLYTSPHLNSFRERIKINGLMISESDVIDFVKNYKSYFSNNKISFFEMTVAMAFDYFSNSQVDIAIIETGLGGRLDATNIIDPILCLITNVGLDHQEFLGKEIRKIAFEKAGIIKNNIPVVISEYQQDIYDVFLNKAKKMNASIFLSDDFEDFEYPSDLNGCFQRKNIKGVVKVIELVTEFNIKNKIIKKGLLNVVKNTNLRGRWDVINESPKVVLDVGHNLGAFKENLKMFNNLNYDKLRIVIGFVKGKDYVKVLKLLPKSAFYYFCQPNNSRALPVEQVYDYSKKIKLNGTCFISVESAYKTSLNDSSQNDFIFIGGSNFVVADLLK